MPLKIIQMGNNYNSLLENSVKATKQKVHDVSFFDRFQTESENFNVYFTYNTRRRGESDIDKQKRHDQFLKLSLNLIWKENK